MARHTDSKYDQELQELRDRLLLMGNKVEIMLQNSMRALVERNPELARETIERDQEINRLEIETDERSLNLLARRQPVASDLRMIAAALKLVTDLERIGDIAVNISERVIESNPEEPMMALEDLVAMSNSVIAMLRDAMRAFADRDVSLAESVLRADKQIDEYYAQISHNLLESMLSNSRNILAGLRLQSIAKYLERVGDHATNIAEMVVYKVKAADIRHTSGAQQPVRPRGILFLCIENAARSQMAEALARSMFPPDIKIFSAGSNPASAVDPMAIQVMKESGLDISVNHPKRISEVPLEEIDTIVTLCSEDVRIGLPGEARRSSWVLPDPSKVPGSEEDRLAAFRSVRDQMQARLSQLADYFGHLK